MLSLGREQFTGELRLYIRCERGDAWITQRPRMDLEHGADWQLWVRRRPGLPARTGKSPLRLMIESRLRAWLLARYHRPLFTLRFEELCGIAEREERSFPGEASEFRH